MDLTSLAVASPENCFDAALFPANIKTKLAVFPITSLSVVNKVPGKILPCK